MTLMTDQEYRDKVLTTLARLDERTKRLEDTPARIDALEQWRDRAIGVYIGVSTVVTLVCAGLMWLAGQLQGHRP